MAFPYGNDSTFIAGYSPIRAQEEIQKMISDVDDDGSGTIGYEELLGHTVVDETPHRPMR